MTPETTQLLTWWNRDRLELLSLQRRMANLRSEEIVLRERMGKVPIQLESNLFTLDQPLGLKIDGDYIVVVQDTHSDDFVIQVVDFNPREEIKNDS
jgi:hypothetical protein